jgi:hypothetical protein
MDIFMKKILLTLMVFGIVGCGDILTYFKDENIFLSCSCMQFKSTDNQCTYSSDVPLIINEEAGILSFNHKTYGSLSIAPTSYSARDDYNLYKFSRSSLQMTHKWGRHIGGGPVVDVYQCSKVQI